MQYIKAKFLNSKRSYTYRTADEVKAGDIVVTDKGAKLTVTDETGFAFDVVCNLTERQRAILLAGGLLNYTKEGGL